MYKTTSLKLEKKQNNYFLHIKNNELMNKFMNSFLLSTKQVIEEYNNKKLIDNQLVRLKLFANEIIPLNDYLKEKINYMTLETLYNNINIQLENLKKSEVGVVKISPKDIFVFKNTDDIQFIFLNSDNIVDMNFKNKIMLIKPFKKDDYLAPEIMNIKKIPTTVSNKCSYWSLGKIILYCLKNYKDNDKINVNYDRENILNKIMNTRLYWAVQRNIEKNPNNRYSILI